MRRASQGYVTLSPARKSKDRSRIERNNDRFEIEHERSVSEQLGQPIYECLKENEAGENLPVRTEQFFRKIPKYSLQEVAIREAFAENGPETHSNRKKKLSVTKLISNIDLSNRSQDGMSQQPSYKLKEFDPER